MQSIAISLISVALKRLCSVPSWILESCDRLPFWLTIWLRDIHAIYDRLLSESLYPLITVTFPGPCCLHRKLQSHRTFGGKLELSLWIAVFSSSLGFISHSRYNHNFYWQNSQFISRCESGKVMISKTQLPILLTYFVSRSAQLDWHCCFQQFQ